MTALLRFLFRSLASAASAAQTLLLVGALALSSLPALAPPTLSALATGLVGRDLTVERVALTDPLTRPALVAQEIRLANASWGSAPFLATARRVTVRPDLARLAESEVGWLDLELEGVDLALETDADGAGNWDLPLEINLEDTGIPLRALDVREASLRLSPAGGAAQELAVATAALDLSEPEAPRLSAEGTWQGAPWALDAQGGPFADLLSGAAWPLGGTLSLAGIQARLDARIEGERLSGRFSTSGPGLSGIGALADPELANLAFSVESELSSRPGTLELERLSATLGPTRLSGALRLDWGGPRPRLSGRLSTPLLALPDRGDAPPALPMPPALVHAELDLAADRLTAAGLDVESVRARLGWDGATLRLSPLAFRLAGADLRGDASIDFKGKTSTLKARLEAPALDPAALASALGQESPVQGRVTDAHLTVSGRPDRPAGLRLDLKAGGAELELPSYDGGEPVVLRLRGITGAAPPGRPIELSGRAALRAGEALWRLGGPTLAQLAAPPAQMPLNLRLESGTSRLTAEGHFRRTPAPGTLNVQAVLESKRIDELGTLLGTPLPSADPIRVQARVSVTPRKLALREILMEAGPNRFTGDLSLLRRGDAIRVSSDLRTPRLHLGDSPMVQALFTPEPSAAAPADAPLDRLIPDLAIPRLPDTALEGRVRIEAGQVSVRGQDLGSLKLLFELEGRELLLEPEILLADGTGLALRLELDDAGKVPALRQRLHITNLDYGTLLKRLEVSDAVTGHLALDLDLAGSGGDLRSLLAGASGHLRVVGGPGQFPGRALTVWSNDLALLLLPGNWDFDAPAHLQCAIADFRIEQGQAASEVLLLDTEKVTVLGNLTVDLKTEALGGKIQPLGKGPSLVSLKTPAQLSGTLTAPKAAPSAGATLTTLGLLAAASANPVALVAVFGSLGSGRGDVCGQALEAGGKGPVSIADDALRRVLDGMFQGLAAPGTGNPELR